MPTRPFPHRPARAAAPALALALLRLPCAHADCIDDAAARHQVDAAVLRAIGWHESRLRPRALTRNSDGSIDVGAFQINSVHWQELARHGVDRTALADGCNSAEVAAWHYRRQIERHGNGWRAIGAFHSATPARAAWYANRIAAILMRWEVLPPGALPFAAGDELAPGRPPPALRPAAAPLAAAASTPSSAANAPAYQEMPYLLPAR